MWTQYLVEVTLSNVDDITPVWLNFKRNSAGESETIGKNGWWDLERTRSSSSSPNGPSPSPSPAKRDSSRTRFGSGLEIYIINNFNYDECDIYL